MSSLTFCSSLLLLNSLDLVVAHTQASNSNSLPPDTIVSTHEGFVVSKSGLVTSSSEILTISLILKIPTFTIAVPDMICFTKSLTKDQVRAAIKKFNENFAALNKSHAEFVTSRLSALEPFVVRKSHKRSAIVFAALSTLLGGALVGITQAQIHSIKSHVGRNSEAIASLHNRVQQISDRQILFEKETVAFLKEFADRTTIALEFEACLDELESFHANTVASYADYKKSIDIIFDAQLRGVNFSPLSAHILDPFTLSKIVKAHESFKHQLYREHPSLLYNVAKLALISINENLSRAHFVLTLPSIVSNIHYPVYTIKHVGVYLPTGICAKLTTADVVYMKNNSLYDIKLNLCSAHFNFFVCPPEAFSVKPSCLQFHSSYCNVTKLSCDSPNSASSIPTGILLRNNKLHDTFRRDTKDKTYQVPLSPPHTALVPWTDTTHIQVGDSLYISPADTFQLEVDFKNFSTNFVYNPYVITVDDIVVAFDNYSKRYNRSLNELLESKIAVDHPIHHAMIIGINTLCLVLTCLAIAFSCIAYRYWCKPVNRGLVVSTSPGRLPAPEPLLENRNSI